MYFTVIWEDPRLVTNMTVEEGTFTPIDLNFLNHMWVPNIFIYDLRFFKSLNVLKKLAGVFIVGTDKVYYNQVINIQYLVNIVCFYINYNMCYFELV